MGINLRVPQNSVKVDGRNSSIYLAQNAIKGDDGGYYIPSIDSEGNLTWAPSEVEMPAVGGTNIKGPKGDSGVWVGTETPDGDYNVWVKPDDEAIEIATKADLDGKQDKLTAGTNITIENNVISATGGSDEVWIGSEEPTGDQTVWIDPTGSETAGLATKAELENKQDKLTAGTNITIDSNNVISAIQPTKISELTNDSGFITNEYHDATKQDKLTAGTNITIADDGTISASHPAQYVNGANATENTLNLYFNNGTSVTFTPTGGSGGSGYAFSSTQTFTDADKAHLKEIYTNKNIYMTIDGLTVVRIMSMGSIWGFVVINTNGATSNQVLVYTVNLDGSGNVTSNTFTLFTSYYLAGNSYALNGDIITSENWSRYITAGGGSDWSGPNIDQSMGDLYNVKQLWIIYQGNNTDAIMQSVLRFDYDSMASTLGGRAYQTFYLHHDDVISNRVYINYDGTNLNISGASLLGYFYKT